MVNTSRLQDSLSLSLIALVLCILPCTIFYREFSNYVHCVKSEDLYTCQTPLLQSSKNTPLIQVAPF